MDLPDEVIDLIKKFCITKNHYYTRNEIKNMGLDILRFFLVFKKGAKEIKINYEIFELISKYDKYQDDYENQIERKNRRKIGKQYTVPPTMIDALFSGCYLPYASSTKSVFDEHVIKDVEKMIKLIPCCLSSSYGQLRCRTNVTPLMASIFNTCVPLSVIDLLLKNGADKHSKIWIDTTPYNMLDDLYSNETFTRYSDIKNIFDKYE